MSQQAFFKLIGVPKDKIYHRCPHCTEGWVDAGEILPLDWGFAYVEDGTPKLLYCPFCLKRFTFSKRKCCILRCGGECVRRIPSNKYYCITCLLKQ